MNTLFERNLTNYKDEWLTPPPIIKALGEFDLDPCAPIVRPWPTAKNHFTIADDGLQKNWQGRIWCNPPYSDITPWLRRCDRSQNAIALTFARTDTNDFYKYVWEKADSIFFILQRLRFYTVQGKLAPGNAGAPSVLIAYGRNNVDALENSGLPGKHLLVNYRSVIIVGISPTWVSVVSIALKTCGDEELKPLYEMVERIAPDKVQKNQHWKAKVRQSLYVYRKKVFPPDECLTASEL